VLDVAQLSPPIDGMTGFGPSTLTVHIAHRFSLAPILASIVSMSSLLPR
jgi:hypothetical protein